jgi:thiopurine S-methyltransferase
MDRDAMHEPWHQRWREGRIGFHRDDVHPMLEYFWSRLELGGDETVFVPLAGKSLDMRWLAERGHRVLAVELSAIAARQFFDEWGTPALVEKRDDFAVHHARGVEIWVGDVFDLRPEHLARVGAFYDRASVVALDRATRERYAAHLASILRAGTRGLLIGLESMQPDDQGPPFSVPQEEVGRLFETAFDHEVLLKPNPESAPEVRALFEHVHRLERHL